MNPQAMRRIEVIRLSFHNHLETCPRCTMPEDCKCAHYGSQHRNRRGHCADCACPRYRPQGRTDYCPIARGIRTKYRNAVNATGPEGDWIPVAPELDEWDERSIQYAGGERNRLTGELVGQTPYPRGLPKGGRVDRDKAATEELTAQLRATGHYTREVRGKHGRDAATVPILSERTRQRVEATLSEAQRLRLHLGVIAAKENTYE